MGSKQDPPAWVERDEPDRRIDRTLVVLQATPFCNINCSYCYLADRDSTRRMSLSTLRRICEAVFASPNVRDKVEFLWHSGEPLVAGKRFYAQAFQIIADLAPPTTCVTQGIQTNATLIDLDWCDLFKAHSVSVGVSLDGPKFLHDLHRRDRRGAGTFSRTMRGVRLLQANSITFGVIMVLTAAALDFADEIWQFFESEGIDNIGFNAEQAEAAHPTSSLAGSVAELKYRAFLKRLLHLRERSGSRTRIRELDIPAGRILKASAPVAASENIPYAILSFTAAGEISTFSPELIGTGDPRTDCQFTFGNISDGPIEQLERSHDYQRVNREIQRGVALCRRGCEYFQFCGGGAPVNKFTERGTFHADETTYCRFRVKVPIDVVLEHLEASAGLVPQFLSDGRAKPLPAYPAVATATA